MRVNDFERSVGADIAQVPVLGEAFCAWAESTALAAREVFHVTLAMEELVTNAILHGFGTHQPGWIHVRACCREDQLTVELRDNAAAFDPFSMPPPDLTRSMDEREVGGLGVHFVRRLMDECSYHREGEENVVTLRKTIGRAR
jgi:anti-sigma regulatory factor (Ser/Thr protein kinase)